MAGEEVLRQTERLGQCLQCCRADQVPTVLKKLTDECIKAEAVDLPKIAEQVVALCSNGHKADTLQVTLYCTLEQCWHSP